MWDCSVASTERFPAAMEGDGWAVGQGVRLQKWSSEHLRGYVKWHPRSSNKHKEQ